MGSTSRNVLIYGEIGCETKETQMHLCIKYQDKMLGGFGNTKCPSSQKYRDNVMHYSVHLKSKNKTETSVENSIGSENNHVDNNAVLNHKTQTMSQKA